MTPETQVYQVTMLIKLERNPRKWIPDTINDCLVWPVEQLIDYTIYEIVSERMTPEERKAYQEYLDDFDPSPIGNGEDYLYPLSEDAWLEEYGT